MVDPCEMHLRSGQRKYLRKNNAPMFPHLAVRLDSAFEESAEGKALLQRCTLLGLHPDEATEAIVDAALKYGRPFAVLPCCVFPSAFPTRLLGDGSVVRSYKQFCTYLLEKAPPGTIQMARLPFAGKNRALYRTLAPPDTPRRALPCLPCPAIDAAAPPASSAQRPRRRGETSLPAAVRVQAVHEYDLDEYQFTEFVCEALGVGPADLSRLHETPAGLWAQKHPPRSGHDPFRRRWLAYITTQPAARRRLDEM
eukprot:3843148-Prymnesium_polylepis.1